MRILPYAYLAKTEVEVLQAPLAQGLTAGPSPYSVDYGRVFPEELLNWLAQVTGQVLDLWIVAQ